MKVALIIFLHCTVLCSIVLYCTVPYCVQARPSHPSSHPTVQRAATVNTVTGDGPEWYR